MLKRISPILFCLLLTAQVAAAEPVCKVVDGDTFHFCNGYKVRLDSIDAPEKGEPYYWQARRALADLLQTRDIKLTNCHTDSTGKRQACGVYADGKDVQAELVREGVVWDWPKYSKGRYTELEKQARGARVGLWADDRAETIHWTKRSRY